MIPAPRAALTSVAPPVIVVAVATTGVLVNRFIAFKVDAAIEVSLTLIVISVLNVLLAEVPSLAKGANRAVISAEGEAAMVVTLEKSPLRDVLSFTPFNTDAVADVSVGVSVKALVLSERTVIALKTEAAAVATVAVMDGATTVLS